MGSSAGGERRIHPTLWPMPFPDAAARRRAALTWTPREGARCITTIDAHAEGEPLRVILAGVPELEAGPVAERRLEAERELDDMRRLLMWEPRGHADMYGCLVLPPERPDSHAAVLFLHNDGWSTMCGHGVLAVTRVLVETGIVAAVTPETRVALDTPAGTVQATAAVHDGRVTSVRFRNVPSWVQALDAHLSVPGLGTVSFDLAFGGAFYAFVDATVVGLELVPGNVRTLVAAATAIKAAAAEALPPVHPLDPSLAFLYGVIFTGPAHTEGHHSRQVCVFADGEVDRSPTGTGVSARAAILHARGELAAGHTRVIESIIGSRFSVCIRETMRWGGRDAVVPEVGGRVAVTGRSEWFVEPDDPFQGGFLVR